MKNTLKVGCLQFSPQLGDLSANINAISALIPSANQADLLVLPELCNSGYNFVGIDQAMATSEPVFESRFINFLIETCSTRQMYIVSGFNERDGADLYNSAVLVGPEGYLGKYQKLHLFNTEKLFFKSGAAEPSIFDLGKIKIGIQICFDWMYPETWRILSLKGADLICHPSNLVLPGLAQKAVPVHAMINRVFTITANRTGTESNLTFTGLSTIANPKGEILAQGSPSEDEVLLVEINPGDARDKWVTKRNNIFEDRLPEHYSCLTQKKG